MSHISRHHFTLTAIALSIFGALPAPAQTINEDIKLTASDAAVDDRFGISVDMFGTTAIVGANGNEDAGPLTGSAYLFDTITGQELFKLVASNAAAHDRFGGSVAISGTIAIVGADNFNGADENSPPGSAYLFDTTTGQQLFELTAADGALDDRFGVSVDIFGTTAIVGAYFDDDAGTNSGSAYLFDTTTGQQLFKLTASDAAAEDSFGISVSISGTTAIVGAFFDDDGGHNSGSAYLFDTTTGHQLFKLTASDGAGSDLFGSSVSISGTTAIVGAFLDDNPGVNNAGSAYLFDTTTGQELLKLTASDAADTDRFGSSVAISGTTVVIGAWGDDDEGSDSGSAYLFSTTTGQQLSKLLASDGAAAARLGASVAISDTTVIVGAYLDDNMVSDSGSAYIFGTPTPCLADLTGDGALDFFDVSLFLTYFETDNPIADFSGDGLINFFDVSAFLIEFAAGCP